MYEKCKQIAMRWQRIPARVFDNWIYSINVMRNAEIYKDTGKCFQYNSIIYRTKTHTTICFNQVMTVWEFAKNLILDCYSY